MIIYENSKAGFLNDAHTCDIEEIIQNHYETKTGRRAPKNEIRSWRESLAAIAKVVNHPDIPDGCGVAIEYVIPQTAKRIDFLLTGLGAARRQQLVIIELKQWQEAKRTVKDGIVRARYASGEAETSHPSYQAWSYACLLKNFNEAVDEALIDLLPCAYLHNCSDAGDLEDDFYRHYLERAPLFYKGETERRKLREHIRRRVTESDGSTLLRRIENARLRPAKGLVDALAGMLAGKPEFTLIDDQKVVYETALLEARKAQSGRKRVVIIEGGPGTGKSVVAINLLVALTSEEHVAKYVTKNAAPRRVFESQLTGTRRRGEIAALFGNSGEFIGSARNRYDTLVVDEAHRLNEKSGLYGNLGNHQVAEIMAAAKCSIFFIDEDQRVTWKDIGSKQEILSRAKAAKAKVTTLELTSQFRCGGSEGYLAWLDDVLGIRETANPVFDVQGFDFRVFDSPEELRREIVQRNQVNNKARMVAGYCWDWKSKKDPAAVDVVIPEHSFGMQWNLTVDGSLWIIAPESVEQIGCIHTCQGLEVDYIGVIIGPDLIVRDGQVVTRPEKRSRQDQSLKGFKKLLRVNKSAAIRKADRLIKNTYRTLLTRGMKGCFVYCTDVEMGRHLKGRLLGSQN